MSATVIGIDLGTSAVRVVAIDLQGKIVAQATRSYPLLTPQPGWTEQHPTDWIRASLAALSEVAQQVKAVAAIGLSGQMHGMVALDADGEVIRPAILWNDQRTKAAVAAIETAIDRNELIQRTGNPAVTGFQLPKVVWLRQNEPEAFARTRHLLLPKDYLGYVLTGNLWTEPSDASGTGCLHLASRQWDRDLLQTLDLPLAWFPPVIDSRAIAGQLQPMIAAQVHLPAGTPVIAGAGDNAAAAIGLGIGSTRLTQGSLSIGTSGVIFAPIAAPQPDPQGRVHLFCHADGGYHLLGVTLAAGGSLRWYRDQFAPQASYEELMQLAAQSPAGANGVLFLPHLAGERSPYLDPDARGAWVNLALATQPADLLRAVLEGVAFSLRAAADVVRTIAPIEACLTTGGGARSRLWLQIFADVLGMKLLRPPAEEGAAYGAALLAGVGAGCFTNLEAAFALLPASGEIIQPQTVQSQTTQPQAEYEDGFDRFKRLYGALKAV